MIGEYMLYDWRVYVVCLASICCMFGEYMLYVWRVYVVWMVAYTLHPLELVLSSLE